MISLFGQLLFPIDADAKAVHTYLRLLGVPATKSAVSAALGEHPNSPSLLSVSDALNGFGVDIVAAKISAEHLVHIESPFIIRMKVGEGLSLAVVKQLNSNSVTYLPPGRHRLVTSDTETFLNRFEGIVLVGEAEERAGQSDYAAAEAAERRQRTKRAVALIVFPLLVMAAIALVLFQYGWQAAIPSLYTLSALAGVAVGGLLLWYEVDRHNPALQQICSGGARINCDSILHSGVSGIFGMSWSLIGFSYFAGALLALLAAGIMDPTIFRLLSILSLFAIAYTIFSLYYQWQVAKQWCLLCLWIQGILVTQAALVVAEGKLFTTTVEFSVTAILTLVTCFAIPFLAGLLVVQISKKAKEGEEHRRELTRLKHDPQIFRALLEKQKAITEPTDGLGIILGNPDAKYRIIKVCNPYCGPCAKAHPIIEEIIHGNRDVQVQIIFTASDDEKDVKTPPVKHLLAIAEQRDKKLLKQALDDWYLSLHKNYPAFEAKYPINGELDTQSTKIKAMRDWCDKMEIRFTPTFFVDGYQLPNVYTARDLEYFLRT